jgi:hypothetical protein
LTEPAASDKLVSSSALKTDWNWWREKSKDLFFFCTVVLHDSWGDAKFGNFGILHKSLCSFLNPYENKNRRLFVSVFRGSFKTTVLLGLVVQMFCWAVANAEPISIVYNTATKDNAQAFMDDFRQTLRQNTLLQWIFPELPQIFEETVSKSRGPKYRRFTLEKVEFQDAKFHVASLDTKQVSRHYSVVINDDLVNDDNAFSEVERANILRKWRLQKSILTKYKKLNTGTEIDVGTPYDKSDLIAHIIREVVGYQKFIVPYAMKADDNKWYLTFPELYEWADFKEKLSDMGESLFSTQYRLKVIDEASKIAKNILYWDTLPEVYNRYLIVDPAGSLNKKNDPTGFLVLDVDERGIYYVLHAEERWIDSYEILKYAEELSKRYKTDEVFFEKEKTSQSLAATVEHLFPKFNFTLTSHDNMPQEKRVIRLRQFFDTKRIFFGRVGQKKLETQVLHYPDVEHDDLIVCLAYGVKQAIPPKKGYVRDADDNERDFGDEISSLVARSEGNENMDAAY